MVIKYSAPQLIAIGELVILKECISKASDRNGIEPQFHPVYMPPTNLGQDPPIYVTNNTAKIPSNSISANNFLEDYAQFQHHLSQSIKHNRDIHLQLQAAGQEANHDQQHQQLSESVAEFFKKAQQNFRPIQNSINQPDSTTATNRARRLSEVEAELLAQLRGHIHV